MKARVVHQLRLHYAPQAPLCCDGGMTDVGTANWSYTANSDNSGAYAMPTAIPTAEVSRNGWKRRYILCDYCGDPLQKSVTLAGRSVVKTRYGPSTQRRGRGDYILIGASTDAGFRWMRPMRFGRSSSSLTRSKGWLTIMAIITGA